jgi:hypothetical protein
VLAGESSSEKGFVVFTTANDPYFSLSQLLVDSLLRFSEHEILLAGVGFEPPSSSTRVKTVRLEADPRNKFDIFLSKFRASLSSPFQLSVQLDADMIALRNVDEIFNQNLGDLRFPSGAVHPGDPRNQRNLMRHLGIGSSSQPYVHGTYLFSTEAKQFLNECLDLGLALKNKIRFQPWLRPHNWDETILNVKLWEKGATASYLHWFDPYFESFFSDAAGRTSIYGRNSEPYVIHGQKCVECVKNELLLRNCSFFSAQQKRSENDKINLLFFSKN